MDHDKEPHSGDDDKGSGDKNPRRHDLVGVATVTPRTGKKRSASSSSSSNDEDDEGRRTRSHRGGGRGEVLVSGDDSRSDDHATADHSGGPRINDLMSESILLLGNQEVNQPTTTEGRRHLLLSTIREVLAILADDDLDG